MFRVLRGALGVVLVIAVAPAASGGRQAGAQTAGVSYTLFRANGSLAGFVTIMSSGFATQLTATLQGVSPNASYVVTVCIGDPSNAMQLTCAGPATAILGLPVAATVTTDASGNGTGSATFGALAPGTVIKVMNAANPTDVATAPLTAQAGTPFCSFPSGFANPFGGVMIVSC